MKYVYTALEAAVSWVGVDVVALRARAEASDLARLEAGHADAVACAARLEFEESAARLARGNFCDFPCSKEAYLPDWCDVGMEGGDILRVLQCLQGFRVKPAEESIEPRVGVRPKLLSREMPLPSEFTDLPEFEQRLAWLN